MKIIVLGAGSWGTALAISASSNANAQNSVTLWARDEAQVALMQASRENARYLAGIALPQSLQLSAIGLGAHR
jgi:glycerol-3-phosphate dehydrogenase (NAD(P)+)